MSPVSRRQAMIGTVALPLAPADRRPGVRPEPSGDRPLDAALIALAAEHLANFRAYNGPGGDDLEPDDDPLWLAYSRTWQGLCQAKPQTFAGIVAKARAARAEAWGPAGPESCRDGGAAAMWAWDVVNDLLRVAGMELTEAELPVRPPPASGRPRARPPAARVAPQERQFVQEINDLAASWLQRREALRRTG